MLDVFNNLNIITFSNKNTTSEEFEDINKVVLDCNSGNMVFLVQPSNYGSMDKIDPKEKG